MGWLRWSNIKWAKRFWLIVEGKSVFKRRKPLIVLSGVAEEAEISNRSDISVHYYSNGYDNLSIAFIF